MALEGLKARMEKYQVFMAGGSVEPKAPITVAKGGGGSAALFGDKTWDKAELKKYRNVFEQGGIVNEAIRIFPLYMFMNGYRLEGDDENKKQLVQDTLDRTNFEHWGREGIIEALVCGSGFQEIVPSTSGGLIAAVYTRDASKFKIDSQNGVITGYRFFTSDQDNKGVPLKPEQILHTRLFTSGGKLYGDSIIKSSYDDIMRDVKNMDGATNAILRHGYPKYHIGAGSDTHPATKADIEALDKEFREINTKNEWVTTHDVTIDMVDNTGMGFNMEAYNRVALQRLVTSLGVPSEVLGLREGTTDATAVSRINTFYKKIGSLQKTYARLLNDQFINLILGPGQEGAVKIVFNEIDAQNEMDKMTWLNLLLKADALNPWAVITRDQLYKFMGWDIKDYKPDDEVEVDVPDTPEPPVEEEEKPEEEVPEEKAKA